jgi:hypothetical protein
VGARWTSSRPLPKDCQPQADKKKKTTQAIGISVPQNSGRPSNRNNNYMKILLIPIALFAATLPAYADARTAGRQTDIRRHGPDHRAGSEDIEPTQRLSPSKPGPLRALPSRHDHPSRRLDGRMAGSRAGRAGKILHLMEQGRRQVLGGRLRHTEGRANHRRHQSRSHLLALGCYG